ncbi:immunity 52 family protein [Denitromonas sp.]|uniref:immunity 52 family protein n=1 Tax=Denitromonas sp. TaxID=2734609 RepID=UPI003A83882E
MKKRPYISHTLKVRYNDATAGALAIKSHLGLVFELLKNAASQDPLLLPVQWLIATGERDSSYLYQAFDEKGPTSAALAVICEDNKGNAASQSFVLWNGEEDQTNGASISCLFSREDARSSDLTFKMRSEPDTFRLGLFPEAVELVTEAARLYKPLYCGLSPEQYDSVFPDRPGVGWMLYLPQVLSVQQVPEARALVPVMGKDEGGKDSQVGTIIVSVTDEPFSDQNPAHVKIANAIEIRLVDQDLLPRYADL